MKTEFNIFLSAVMFLTRLPVSRWVSYRAEYLSKSTVYFPLVGAIVGGIGAFAMWIFSLAFTTAISVLGSMLVTVLATGAFHEDGLADSFDGFGGGFNKERVLEIMKDSRIGTYGAVALWFALSIKFFFLYEIASENIFNAALVMICAHLLARYSSLILIFNSIYVRGESSPTKPFAERITPKRLIIATLYSIGICIWLLESFAVVAVLTILAVGFYSKRYFDKRIGGITGDALGAANQIAELSVYFSMIGFRTLFKTLF